MNKMRGMLEKGKKCFLLRCMVKITESQSNMRSTDKRSGQILVSSKSFKSRSSSFIHVNHLKQKVSQVCRENKQYIVWDIMQMEIAARTLAELIANLIPNNGQTYVRANWVVDELQVCCTY